MSAKVIWITGLSGAGKSTLATGLVKKLIEKKVPVEHFDGDELRNLFPHTGFSREERHNHIIRVGYMASRLEAHGVWVVASLISPYRESREKVRSFCKNFIEVYVSTPLSTCEARDPKGLYKKARANELRYFNGISAPYEPPEKPEVQIDTSQTSFQESLNLLLRSVS